jgi:xylose isomerase
VKDFASGCMRTYLILKEKAFRWNADPEIQAILKEISGCKNGTAGASKFSKERCHSLAGARLR